MASCHYVKGVRADLASSLPVHVLGLAPDCAELAGVLVRLRCDVHRVEGLQVDFLSRSRAAGRHAEMPLGPDHGTSPFCFVGPEHMFSVFLDVPDDGLLRKAEIGILHPRIVAVCILGAAGSFRIDGMHREGHPDGVVAPDVVAEREVTNALLAGYRGGIEGVVVIVRVTVVYNGEFRILADEFLRPLEDGLVWLFDRFQKEVVKLRSVSVAVLSPNESELYLKGCHPIFDRKTGFDPSPFVVILACGIGDGCPFNAVGTELQAKHVAALDRPET